MATAHFDGDAGAHRSNTAPVSRAKKEGLSPLLRLFQAGPKRRRLAVGPALADHHLGAVQRHRRSHLVGARAQHHQPRLDARLLERRQHVLQHRPAVQGMQLLGPAEPTALPCGEHERSDPVA